MLGIFNDLSKVFDTVDHRILTKKLDLYVIKGYRLRWFESYLSNWKQFIRNTDKQNKYRNYYMWSSSGPNFMTFVTPNFC